MFRVSLLLLLCVAVPSARAGDAPPQAADAYETAVRKGIAFLLTQQKQDTGAIHDKQAETAMTALACLALMAVGHCPGDPDPEGEAVRKGIGFVLREDRQFGDKEQFPGYFNRDGTRMYGHGIVTLMLSEALGMGADAPTDALIRVRLEKAVPLILKAQAVKKDPNQTGGWRYEPNSGDSDLSPTIWMLLALRSAKNAGLEVPKEAIDQAVAYVKRSYSGGHNPDGTPKNAKSACAYQVGGGPGYSAGCAGLLALQLCGAYDAPEVAGSAAWIREFNIDPNQDFFYYGTYYLSQGMYQRGGSDADYGMKKVTELLLPRQQPGGQWKGNGNEDAAGLVYSTSMALLSLSVRYHFLPIYQR